jgi:replicative DNA helicase
MTDFNINDIEGYVTPQDIDAEKAVLGACLMSADAVDTLVSVLPKDLEVFYTPIHQLVYRAILELYAESQPIDIITVTKKLRDFNTG